LPKLEGLRELLDALKRRQREWLANGKGATVVVGYTQNYALYVHEDLTAHHNVGQAKYLEQPAREFGNVIGKLVSETFRQTHNLTKSLLVGGLRLQRESQLLVPVRYGLLKASAFTRAEDE